MFLGMFSCNTADLRDTLLESRQRSKGTVRVRHHSDQLEKCVCRAPRAFRTSDVQKMYCDQCLLLAACEDSILESFLAPAFAMLHLPARLDLNAFTKRHYFN